MLRVLSGRSLFLGETMNATVSAESAPPLGDVRTMGPGDVLRLAPGWKSRPDWTRYLAAAAHALARGARVEAGADRG